MATRSSHKPLTSREHGKLYRQRHPDRCAAQKRKYIEKNKEKVCAYQRQYYHTVWKIKHPGYSHPYTRNSNYQRKYGITLTQYEDMLQQQEGKCAICNTAPKKRRLAVDHNHKTGELRQLLCIRCNHAIGVLEHDLLPVWEAYLDGRRTNP